ncbi:hypothetical protein [Brevundimonas sp.]|uniref:hypothetical protein n=1 Tax=Brevundimonas sp. TaxID=1871086 RepID=UPI002FC8FFF5
MIRILVLSGVMLTALAAGGCALRYDRAEETTSVGSLDRAERARAEAARMHPECRDERTDRDRQPEGCETVVRKN